MIVGKVNIAPLLRDLRKFPGQFERTLKEVVDTEARGFVKDAVQTTPPFHKRAQVGADGTAKMVNVNGSAAKKAGEAQVDRDARALFVGVALKGKRTLNHLFGDTDPDVGRKPPYVLDTVEQWPDVDRVWSARAARRTRYGIGRGRRADLAVQMTAKAASNRGAYYVSGAKLRRAVAVRKKRVGYLAAGWLAAARALNVNLPAWITRHGPRGGSVSVRRTSGSYSVRIVNAVSYGDRLGLQAIANRALQVRQGKLERRIPHVLRGAIKRARLESIRAA